MREKLSLHCVGCNMSKILFKKKNGKIWVYLEVELWRLQSKREIRDKKGNINHKWTSDLGNVGEKGKPTAAVRETKQNKTETQEVRAGGCTGWGKRPLGLISELGRSEKLARCQDQCRLLKWSQMLRLGLRAGDKAQQKMEISFSWTESTQSTRSSHLLHQ